MHSRRISFFSTSTISRPVSTSCACSTSVSPNAMSCLRSSVKAGSTRDSTGARRLDDPDDFVRIEIASALDQGKRVIPVLVGEAQMPGPDELPEPIRPLARRNAVRLTHERFRADMQGLVKALRQTLVEFDEMRKAALKTARRTQTEERHKQVAQTATERARAHQSAMTSGSRAELRAFLDSYPNGADARQVRRCLRRLEAPAARDTRSIVIAGVGALAVVLVLGVAAFWLRTDRAPRAASPAAVATAPAPAPVTVAASSTPVSPVESAPTPSPDAIAWSLLKGTSDDNSLKRFVAQYPDSPFRRDADAQIAALAAAEAARVAATNCTEMTRSVQVELKRVGCYDGALNGQFDDATRTAWRSFGKLAGAGTSDEPTADSLKTLKSIDKRVCPLQCPSGQRAESNSCVADAPPKRVIMEVPASQPGRAGKPPSPEPKLMPSVSALKGSGIASKSRLSRRSGQCTWHDALSVLGRPQ